MIGALRWREAVSSHNLKVWLVSAGVLLAAIPLAAHPSIRWLVLLAGLLALVALLHEPLLGLMATIVVALVFPFELGTGRDVSLNLAAMTVPATFMVWLLMTIRRRDVRLPASRTTTPLLLLVLGILLSLVIGDASWDPAVPQPGNLLLVQLGQWGIFAFSAMAFWLTGSLVHDEARLRRLTFLYLGVAGTLAVIRVLPHTYGFTTIIATLALDRAPFWLLLGTMSAGQLLFNQTLSARWRWFLVAALVAVMAYAFFLERETLSNLAGVGPVFAVLAWLRWPRLRWVFVVVALLGVTVFFPVIYNFAGGTAEWNLSGGSRLALSGRVIEVSLRNPITGLGPAAYRSYARMKPLPYEGAYWLEPLVNSHNNYVDLFSQGGILALVLFFWFSAEVILLGIRLCARYKDGFAAGYVHSMLAAWFGALVVMVFADWILPFVYNIGFSGYQASILVWLFMGGLVALEQMPAGHKGEPQVHAS